MGMRMTEDGDWDAMDSVIQKGALSERGKRGRQIRSGNLCSGHQWKKEEAGNHLN